MSASKHRKHTGIPGGFFHLEEEKSKTRVTGYGHGDHIKLKDDFGNVWVGSAERGVDNAITYRFRNGYGRTLSGISEGATVTLRDEKGTTWKGFVN